MVEMLTVLSPLFTEKKREREKEWRREGRKRGEGARVWKGLKKGGGEQVRARQVRHGVIEDHAHAMCVRAPVVFQSDEDGGKRRKGPQRRGTRAGGLGCQEGDLGRWLEQERPEEREEARPNRARGEEGYRLGLPRLGRLGGLLPFYFYFKTVCYCLFVSKPFLNRF
jgi:hypothetical protein